MVADEHGSTKNSDRVKLVNVTKKIAQSNETALMQIVVIKICVTLF